MEERLRKLKDAFARAKNDKERMSIDAQIQALIAENGDLFAETMVAMATESAEKAKLLAIKRTLEDILPAISVSYIAQHYFDKTGSWLRQRINGNIVNGKVAQLSKDEMNTLSEALADLSRRMGLASADVRVSS